MHLRSIIYQASVSIFNWCICFAVHLLGSYRHHYIFGFHLRTIFYLTIPPPFPTLKLPLRQFWLCCFCPELRWKYLDLDLMFMAWPYLVNLEFVDHIHWCLLWWLVYSVAGSRRRRLTAACLCVCFSFFSYYLSISICLDWRQRQFYEWCFALFLGNWMCYSD